MFVVYPQLITFLYEVHDGKIHSVNLEKLTCTCRTWHTSKIPCIHVVKVCEETGRSIMPYVSPYFTTELWRLAYAEVINPVPNNDMPLHVSIDNSNDYIEEEWSFDYENVRGSSQLTQVLPPNVRRRPRRPKRKRIESQPVDKRSLCCSRCHEQGLATRLYEKYQKGTSISRSLPSKDFYPLISAADDAFIRLEVVCPRGDNARVEKEDVTARADGVGMIVCKAEADAPGVNIIAGEGVGPTVLPG
ncbi:hypothetical protein BUALT_Bualt03G0095400 [Buddleja alternifolia]|uniref:SWIM-type domain-containing protein n=1 Tax=Buddleja alternifolia TaxID=168488 RepID=A0AAV6Y3M5_9LAMI|nr:hypothetical protein BUALT_Bualt03G0095400 [Buddleja alternifolia]